MKPQDYIKAAARTDAGDWYEENVLSCGPGLLHAGMGLVTESGEFMDMLKKHFFYGKKLDLVNLEEELGDLMWYTALACRELDVSFEQLFEKNINKLKARYPEKFTSEEALNRNLNKERAVLEE